MTEEHTELVAELRALAETVLDRLDPILERAATGAVKDSAADGEPTGSSCSWCPLCALAALIRGEQHDLVTHVAAQASTFLAELRNALEEHAAQVAHDGATSTMGEEAAPAPPFVPIDVTIRNS
ncbi:hypothetical protein [Rhodococcus xishaensis]|uniref:hypothetical protein n=1 Tax=Rhodococcus xishaensis TaxID=2487364 RepID=UPI0019D47592|nr:hypothetical protein [Rhodococcus xishaensis]